MDISGNIANAQRKIIVKPDLPPVVSLIGDSVITLNQDSVFSDSGATWTDEVDGS